MAADTLQQRYGSDHWPTVDEWEAMLAGSDDLEERVEKMRLRLKAMVAAQGPVPTFEDLGVHAIYARYLARLVENLAGIAIELAGMLPDLDEVRLTLIEREAAYMASI